MAQNKVSNKKDCNINNNNNNINGNNNSGTNTGNNGTGVSTPSGHDNHHVDINKLNHEIVILKDANKVLEDKLQVSF